MGLPGVVELSDKSDGSQCFFVFRFLITVSIQLTIIVFLMVFIFCGSLLAIHVVLEVYPFLLDPPIY